MCSCSRLIICGVIFAFAAAISPVQAEPADLKIVALEKVDTEPGLVTPEVAARFNSDAASVESRIKAAFLANLEQQMAASTRLKLSVRGESLKRLISEWKTAEAFGNGKNADPAGTGPGIDEAGYMAETKIIDFAANRDALVQGGATLAARWSLEIAATLNITDIKTGNKVAAITEKVSIGEKGRGAVNFTSSHIQQANAALANKLAARVLDSLCPIRILSIRGQQFIIDRGVRAGVMVGDKYTVMEPAGDSNDTDAGFPIGCAVVQFVNEKSSNLIIQTNAQNPNLEIKKTYSLSRLNQ